MEGKIPRANAPHQFHQSPIILPHSLSTSSSNVQNPFPPSQFVPHQQQIALSAHLSNPFGECSPQQIVQQLAARTGLDPMQLAKLFSEQQIPQAGHPNQMPLLSSQRVANAKLGTMGQIVAGNGGGTGPAAQQHPHLPGEELCDSGNETSSLSPGHTPMTASSPHSLPSRSNSFSVSSILRPDNPAKLEKRSEESKLVVKKQPFLEQGDNSGGISDSSLPPSSTTPIAAPIPLRLPFGLVQQQPPNSIQIPAQISVQHNQMQQNALASSMHLQGLFGPRQNATNAQQIPSAPANAVPPFMPPAMPGGMQQFLLSNPGAMLAFFHHQHQMQMQQQYLPGEHCVVCGDRASGHHYGVLSCEGCKGFFRRSIQHSAQHLCHKNSQCPIDRLNRNRCQKCRFDKCILKGMQPSHVRLEKNKKRKSDLEPREGMVEGMRQNMELTKTIVEAFKAIFLQNPPPENNLSLPLPIVPISNVIEGRQMLSRFIESVNAFKELPPMEKEILLLRVPIILIILSVFAHREEMIIQLNLPIEKFKELKAVFVTGNRAFCLEEAALLMCCALTAYSQRQNETQIEKLHVWLWKCTHEQILDRNVDDDCDENIDPMEICLNLTRVNFQINFR